MIQQFLIIGLLTLVNAFFASAEMAMVSVNKNRLITLSEAGNKKAQQLIKLLDEPSKFLATIQVGITLAGFFSSAFAATGLSVGLGEVFIQAKIPYAQELALILVTIALSFVMLLLGELFPKRLALQKSEAVAMFSITPIYYISIVSKPFVKLLSVCTNALIRLLGMDQEALDQKVTEEEIRSMIKVGQEAGVINSTEKKMINSIFEFDDKLARTIMTPRTDVLMVDLGDPQDKIIDDLVQLKFSRIPVYIGDKDHIVGQIHIKNILVAAKEKGLGKVDFENIMKKPFFAPETIRIDQLFVRMQKAQEHMTLLLDEHGMMTGIVTMEDLIEEVMGNIDDEFDDATEMIEKLDNGVYRVNGRTPIFEFNTFFDTTLSDETVDSIGGYIIRKTTEVPSTNDEDEKSIMLAGYNFKIEKVIEHRIISLIVTKVERQ